MTQKIVLIDDNRMQIWHNDIPEKQLQEYVFILKQAYLKGYNVINTADNNEFFNEAILLFDVSGSKRKVIVTNAKKKKQ